MACAASVPASAELAVSDQGGRPSVMPDGPSRRRSSRHERHSFRPGHCATEAGTSGVVQVVVLQGALAKQACWPHAARHERKCSRAFILQNCWLFANPCLACVQAQGSRSNADRSKVFSCLRFVLHFDCQLAAHSLSPANRACKQGTKTGHA